jgi:circadian clock protein KaiC
LEGGKEEGFNRVGTLIDDFDGLIGGGIPRGHVCLLSGPSGAMKTSIALYILHHNEARGLHPLYISLEETKESLQEGQRSLGLESDSDFVVDIGRLRTDHTEVEEEGNWIDVLKQFITKRRRYRKVDLLVIDSITGLYSLTDMQDLHRELFHFFAFLRNLRTEDTPTVRTQSRMDCSMSAFTIHRMAWCTSSSGVRNSDTQTTRWTTTD